MKTTFFLSISITFTMIVSAQTPVTQIEGFLEVYHPNDSTSIYIGKSSGNNVDDSFTRSNCFIGNKAGLLNTTGNHNNFVGRWAGYSNISGNSNNFVGASAGYKNIDGRGHSIFGDAAGFNTTSGENNSFFGLDAGHANKTGNHNTIIGTFANVDGPNKDSLNYATAIGAEALVSTDNTVVLGRPEDRVSVPGKLTVGTSTATTINSVAAGRNSIASGNISTAFGDNSQATGEVSTAFGFGSHATGFHSIALGTIATASGSYSMAFGKDISTNGKSGAMILGDSNPGGAAVANVGANNQMVARFGGGYYFITGPGFGIKADPNANMWSAISDVNKKENFQFLDDKEVLEKLASVDYSSWNYKGQDPSTFRHYGIMAQDFYKLFGVDEYGTIGNDTLVNPTDMMGVVMSALKGAKIEIEELESENAQLINRIDKIEQILAKLTAGL